MSERNILKVSTLVHYLKKSMDADPYLHNIYVEGEISNLRKPNSGHWYFSLKDTTANINCVMFSSYNRTVDFNVVDGDKIIVKGDVSIYEAQGSLQIIITDMKKSGIGDLYQKFEELKKKLEKEGYFNEENKKPLPAYPMNIALVTGNQTAAREDVLMILDKRWPIAKVHEFHTPVQGNEASPQIIEALKKADEANCDVILLVRGGGSIEDLWCFNDENLAKFIFSMKTPVVTGVGHQIDYTLVDFVADVRANTPTGAVEISTPDIVEVYRMINNMQNQLITEMKHSIGNYRKHFDQLKNNAIFVNPTKLYQEAILKQQYLNDRLEQFHLVFKQYRYQFNHIQHKMVQILQNTSNENKRMIHEYQLQLQQMIKTTMNNQSVQIGDYKKNLLQNMQNIMHQKQMVLQQNIKLLDAYSPLKIMQRGFAIVTKEDKTIKDVHNLNINDYINIKFENGSAQAQIKETNDD